MSALSPESPTKPSECSNGSLAEAKGPAKIDSLSYPLERSPFYRLGSETWLAKLLECNVRQLRRALQMNDNERYRKGRITETKYRFDRVRKILVPTDKIRDTRTPIGLMERIHRRIFLLLNRIEKPHYLHSGVHGRSYVTNARTHRGAKTLAKADIEKFFPSVRRFHIFQFFAERMACPRDIAGRLANICTSEGCLPTGSCISQLLAFWVFKPMFDEIYALAEASGLTMTLYVDDIVVSGAKASPGFLFKIRRTVCRHGLKLHKLHTWSKGVGLATGVVVAGQELRLPNLRRLIIRDEFRRVAELRLIPGIRARKQRARLLKRLIGKCHEAGQFDEGFKTAAAQLTSELGKLAPLRVEAQDVLDP